MHLHRLDKQRKNPSGIFSFIRSTLSQWPTLYPYCFYPYHDVIDVHQSLWRISSGYLSILIQQLPIPPEVLSLPQHLRMPRNSSDPASDPLSVQCSHAVAALRPGSACNVTTCCTLRVLLYWHHIVFYQHVLLLGDFMNDLCHQPIAERDPDGIRPICRCEGPSLGPGWERRGW